MKAMSSDYKHVQPMMEMMIDDSREEEKVGSGGRQPNSGMGMVGSQDGKDE